MPESYDIYDLDAISSHLRRFAAARDWQRYHTPANLATALAVEAGELLELFLWGQAPATGLTTPRRSAPMATTSQAALSAINARATARPERNTQGQVRSIA